MKSYFLTLQVPFGSSYRPLQSWGILTQATSKVTPVLILSGTLDIVVEAMSRQYLHDHPTTLPYTFKNSKGEYQFSSWMASGSLASFLPGLSTSLIV